MNSIRYIIFLIIFIILLPGETALAAGERYRVEVLVLMHLDHAEQGEELRIIRDYSPALDFLVPAVEEPELPEGCEPVPEEISDSVIEPVDPLSDPEAIAEEEVEEIDPNAVLPVEEMGPEMQDAWRRLRLSGPFRPLQYLSWEQGSEEPFPSLRVHDDVVVQVDDPWADLREPEDELIAVYGDTANSDPDDADPDCTLPAGDPLPEPTLYYALDGTVSLVRTRFLHLNLDLQLRQELQSFESGNPSEPSHPLIPGTAPSDETAPGSIPDQPSMFLVHGLEQSRQVRSRRMEYFDGPVISVLAWITPIPVADAEER